MKDEDHEAFGAMIHRGKVDAATAGRDYHTEIYQEREALAERVNQLEHSNAALREEIERLTRERDDYSATVDLCAATVTRMTMDRDALREALQGAREAMHPIKEALDRADGVYCDANQDEWTIQNTTAANALTYGKLRAIRAALAQIDKFIGGEK